MFLLQKMPSGFMDKIHRVERLRRADECVRRYTTKGKRAGRQKGPAQEIFAAFSQ